MLNNNLKEIAYERYKLDWMLNHGHTIPEMMKALVSYAEDTCNNDLESLIKNWEMDSGFSSEIWASFEEFCATEYLDRVYMEKLLPKDQFCVWAQLHDKQHADSHPQKVIVYKQYNDSDAYGAETIRVFALEDLALARSELKRSVEAHFDKKWEDIDIDEYDTLTEDYVSIWDGDGTSFWILEIVEVEGGTNG